MAFLESYEPTPVTTYIPTESRFTPKNGIEYQQNYTNFIILTQ
jgi:hypothetical protein